MALRAANPQVGTTAGEVDRQTPLVTPRFHGQCAVIMVLGAWIRSFILSAGCWALTVHAAERPARRGGNPLDRFEQLDRDHDGRITPEELDNPLLFKVLDLNQDGVILRAEAAEAIAELDTRQRWARSTNAPATATAPLTESLQALPGAPLGLGKRLAEITIRGLDGRTQVLAPGVGRRALVVAVTSSSCPLSGRYAPVLARLEQGYQERGVDFVFLAPVATDTPDSLRTLARTQGWRGPVVADSKQEVASVLGVRATTEVFVYDAARTLVYRGAIDDQYGLGYARAAARVQPLRQALEAVLAGGTPALAATSAPGCVVELPVVGKGNAVSREVVTYQRQISRLLQQHCLECHRTGGLAPFSLERYEDVVAHAGIMRKQVERGVMPPWFAAPSSHVIWSNDRSLPEADRQELLSWLAGDKPLGEAEEAPLPRAFPGEWRIGQPDAIYQAPRAIVIPAEGVMKYQNVVVETGLTSDRWVSAMEIQPTARSVVHHVLVFAQHPGDRKGRRGDDASDERAGFFAAYVPGNSFEQFPAGFGKRLAAGSVLRFQIHYTPNGTATNDQIRIGLKFLAQPPEHAVHVIGLANPLLRIPAGAKRHEEHAGTPVPRTAHVLAFLPHMHLRGAAFRYEVEAPDGNVRTLLDIPRYDFNWQLTYRCANPLVIEAGSRLRAIGWYDNSSGNPANPDPTRDVRWGPQTYDEMMLGYVEYYFPGDGL